VPIPLKNAGSSPGIQTTGASARTFAVETAIEMTSFYRWHLSGLTRGGYPMDDRIEKLIDELETRRDKLRVKLDLGKREVEDAWHDLEEDWDKLELKLKQLGKDAVDDRDKVRDDIKGLADDLTQSLEKLRNRFAS
jgi:hypothetical protein